MFPVLAIIAAALGYVRVAFTTTTGRTFAITVEPDGTIRTIRPEPTAAGEFTEPTPAEWAEIRALALPAHRHDLLVAR